MAESLRIAFFTDSFLPARDGVVTSILNFRRELTKRGHEVYIFAPGDEQTQKMAKGLKNVYLIKGMKFKKYPQYSLALLPFSSASKFDEINPDIVHSHTPVIMGTWALYLAKMNKIPIVSTFHTLFTDKAIIKAYATEMAANFWQKYSWKYARFYYRKCNAVMVPSMAIRKLLSSKHINDTYLVPNGIDTSRFNTKADGKAVRKSLLKGNKEQIVLCVGRLSTEKKLEVLIRAAQLLKNESIRFVFVGTGPAMSSYMKMVERLGLTDKITFTGFVSDRELPMYYAACDIFCMPSTFETQGIVALEAMAAGKPVVAADSLALRDLVQNGANGEKFTPNDSKDCARKIKKVINNVASYKEMAETAKSYSVEATTGKLLEVYRKVISEATV